MIDGQLVAHIIWALLNIAQSWGTINDCKEFLKEVGVLVKSFR